MTREDAIKELKTRYLTMSQCFNKEELHRANKAIDMAIKALEQEPKWILVSERLPDKEGEYLLWGRVTEDEEGYYSFIGDFDSGCEEFGIWEEQYDRSTHGCLGSDFFEYDKVIAWLPLPEPYKIDKESD